MSPLRFNSFDAESAGRENSVQIARAFMHFQAAILYGLVFISGFAGLGYEMVWTRMLSVGLGHEIISVLAVVSGFFCGMAMGSWVLAGPVSRSSTPGRFYAFLEALIGIWAIALLYLIPICNSLASKLMGAEPSALIHWAISFLFPFLVLLPATFAMGGTLPAMERLLSSFRHGSRSVGALYASNTLGAVAGILITTFLIAPRAGFSVTLLTLAGINFMCAAGACVFGKCERSDQPRTSVPVGDIPSSPRLLLSLFVTGFLGIGYEVLVIRVMSQVLENTIYSFSGVLAIYLLGTACGAFLYQKFIRGGQFRLQLSHLLGGTSAACLFGILLLGQSEAIYAFALHATGGDFAGSVIGEMALALAVLFVPTVMMGATFSHLAQAASWINRGLGRALCLNTLGSALAPFLFGVILLPFLGSKVALLLIATGYLLLIPRTSLAGVLPAAASTAIALIIALSPFNLQFVTLKPGDEIVEHREGVMAAVTVVKDAGGEFHLKVNNHFQMGGTSSQFSDRREGHIPILLHPNPKSALFLGMGTGGTLAAAADHRGLEVDGVELVPEIIPMLDHFRKANGDMTQQEHLRIKVADARRYVTACKKTYDVVVADLFHPARDGAGSLYTVEHFSAIRALLNPDGLFCQWLPLYQLDETMLRTIIRTFLHVFPEGSAYVANYSIKMPILALVSGTKAVRYPTGWYSERVTDHATLQALESVKLDNSHALFGCFVAAKEDLAAFAGIGPLNTDTFPVVLFGAPRFAYLNSGPAHDLLLSLIDSSGPKPEQLFMTAVSDAEHSFQKRLAYYWAARNNFLHAGVGIPETGDVIVLLKFVRDPLLSIIRTSPDFSPAYMPLIAMANGLYRRDPGAAKVLLDEIEAAAPLRHEARQVRARLFPEP